MTLIVQELTPESFAPFGDTIMLPGEPADAIGPGWQWWAKTALLPRDERPYAVGYLQIQPAGRRVDWAERHPHSAEVIVPLGGDCIVYVAPPDDSVDPAQLPGLDRFQAFRVRCGQGVILHSGVWHGAPLAVDVPLAVLVLLPQGTGQTDTSMSRFPHAPLDIHL